ncbi:12799_t:CDS:2 [Acaulospora colombiana]|uniref:12799_t:CDS:1 n=1 Tax=Acaulospora colombiana TaxID=27376 RepID=A0ACA9N8N5_9GLOM|nr:12799_t:CDS:2 [Acaulospora colombiana]
MPDNTPRPQGQVLGNTGSGKSSVSERDLDYQFINAAAGSTQMAESTGLRSLTTKVAATDPFMVDNQRVVLLDTPGFDNTNGMSFREIMLEIQTYLTRKCVDSSFELWWKIDPESQF